VLIVLLILSRYISVTEKRKKKKKKKKGKDKTIGNVGNRFMNMKARLKHAFMHPDLYFCLKNKTGIPNSCVRGCLFKRT